MNSQEISTHEFGMGLLHDHIDGPISSTVASAYRKDNRRQYVGANDRFIHLSGLTTQRDLPGVTDQDLIWNKLSPAIILNDRTVSV